MCMCVYTILGVLLVIPRVPPRQKISFGRILTPRDLGTVMWGDRRAEKKIFVNHSRHDHDNNAKHIRGVGFFFICGHVRGVGYF